MNVIPIFYENVNSDKVLKMIDNTIIKKKTHKRRLRYLCTFELFSLYVSAQRKQVRLKHMTAV